MDTPSSASWQHGEADLFRLLVENTTDYAIFVVDGERRVRTWGPGAERTLGYGEGEIIGQSMDRFFTPEDIESGVPQEEMRLARETGRANEDHWHVRKDGSRFWSNGVLTPLRETGGAVRGFAKIMRDRTDLMVQSAATAEQLRLTAFVRDVGIALTTGGEISQVLKGCAEAMVRHLEAAFARIWTLDEAGGVLVLQASAGMYTHLDGPHSRVPVGQFKIGLIAAERKPHLTNSVVGDPRVSNQAWAVREGIVAFAGYPLLVEDRLVGVMAMFARRPLSEATLQTMASVAHGIALGIERSSSARRLAQSQWERTRTTQLSEAVVQAAFDGIIICDKESRVVDFNSAAERLFGYDKAEVIGRDITDLIVPPRLRDAHRRGMTRLLTTEVGVITGQRVEMPALRSDGTEFTVEMAVTHVPLDDNSLFVADIHDISERIEADRRLNARLAANQALAQGEKVVETVQAVLRAVCENMGWDVGLFWAADPDAGVMRCVTSWRSL